MASLIQIGSVDIPMPASYSASTSTIVDSGRNADGRMIGSVIRDDVAKVEVGWKFLSTEQWSMILKLFNIAYGGKFVNEVRFFNQTTGDYETRTMYVGDKKAGLFRLDESGNVVGWLDCKFSLIEV